MTRRAFLAAPALAAAQAGRSRFGVARDSFRFRPYTDTLEFLERCHQMGAAGIQGALTSTDPAYIRRLRARAEQLGMYIELQSRMPGANMEQFVAIMKAGAELGARCVRVVNPGPRRYEAFKSLEDWQAAVAEADSSLRRALPIARSTGVALAIENHRDWTLEEFLARMKQYASEYAGCCLDFGNNFALLDRPLDVVEALAPYAITTHVKDIAAAETRDGFTMSEVPLGAGIIDVKRAIDIVRRARPDIRLVIEMITREPTPVPCLTDRYWSLMPRVSARDMARALRLVPERAYPFPRVDGLPEAAQRRLEEEHVRKCLAWSA